MVNPHGERTITIASAAFIILTLVSTAHAPSAGLLRSVSDKLKRTFSNSGKLIKQRSSPRLEQQQPQEPCLRDYGFKGGDLIVGKDKTLFFALDSREIVYMEVLDTKKKEATFRRVSLDGSWGGPLVKSRESFPFGGGKGIALASVFVDRMVPYHSQRCNQAHYMDYFTLGRVRSVQGRSDLDKDCPLHRTEFRDVRGSEISTNQFYLLKKNGSRVYPFNFEKAPISSIVSAPPPSSFTGLGQSRSTSPSRLTSPSRSTSPSRRSNIPESSNRLRHSSTAHTIRRTSTFFRSLNLPLWPPSS